MSISLRPLSSSSTVRTASKAMLQARVDQRLRALVLMAEFIIFSIMSRLFTSTGVLWGQEIFYPIINTSQLKSSIMFYLKMISPFPRGPTQWVSLLELLDSIEMCACVGLPDIFEYVQHVVQSLSVCTDHHSRMHLLFQKLLCN